MKKLTVILLALTGFLLSASVLFADEKYPIGPWKKFNVSLGASFIANDSKVRLGGEGVGVEVDVEEVLGLDTQTVTARLDGYWRFMKRRRHRIDFTYYSNRRSGEGIVDRDIELPDFTIDAGSGVETEFNFDLYQIGYSYSFFMDERMDLGFGAGFYILPVEFKLRVTAASDGTPVFDESVKESFTAPLPVFNLRGDFAITDRWQFRSRINIFYLEFDQYSGGILDSRLAVEYQPFKHIGFGLAWDNFRLAAEAKEENNDIPGATFKGTFKFQNMGAMLYLKANF